MLVFLIQPIILGENKLDKIAKKGENGSRPWNQTVVKFPKAAPDICIYLSVSCSHKSRVGGSTMWHKFDKSHVAHFWQTWLWAFMILSLWSWKSDFISTFWDKISSKQHHVIQYISVSAKRCFLYKGFKLSFLLSLLISSSKKFNINCDITD